MAHSRSIPSRQILRGLMSGTLMFVLFAHPVRAQEFTDRIDGDIGLGAYDTRSVIRGKNDPVSVLPYGAFDYGRIFMRLDTLGIKTLKLGYGYLEVAGRFSQDGFRADVPGLRGLRNRQDSVPLGLGTMQTTPMGAFFINAFHDVNRSNGDLYEAIYAAELGTPELTVYPLAGAEYQSAAYVRYYYGISAQEAVTSRYAVYQPSGAFSPLLGVMLDARLTERYHLNFYVRRKWLGNAIQSSPLVGTNTLDTSFIALSYRFE